MRAWTESGGRMMSNSRTSYTLRTSRPDTAPRGSAHYLFLPLCLKGKTWPSRDKSGDLYLYRIITTAAILHSNGFVCAHLIQDVNQGEMRFLPRDSGGEQK